MLLAGYASDSDSDNEAGPSPKPVVKASPAPAAGVQPVTGSTTTKGKKRGGPIRITLDLPKGTATTDGDNVDGLLQAQEEGGGEAEECSAAKKAKVGPKGGKGSSLLLGMLPAPKRKLPAAPPPDKKSSLLVNKSMANADAPALSSILSAGLNDHDGVLDAAEEESAAGPSMLPPSMTRRNKQAKKEESLDLFGLSSSSSSTKPSASTHQSSDLKPPSITSAPTVADFVPPEPTPKDPYPGYYQLPSGQWAAYDPEYYHSFFAPAAQETGVEDMGGRVGKHWADLDSTAEIAEVRASMGIEEARAEELRRQSMAKPKVGDQYEYKAIGQIKGLASERHQLTSLLNTAFSQRDELEERLASNKKTARMSKAKYGF